MNHFNFTGIFLMLQFFLLFSKLPTRIDCKKITNNEIEAEEEPADDEEYEIQNKPKKIVGFLQSFDNPVKVIPKDKLKSDKSPLEEIEDQVLKINRNTQDKLRLGLTANGSPQTLNLKVLQPATVEKQQEVQKHKKVSTSSTEKPNFDKNDGEKDQGNSSQGQGQDNFGGSPIIVLAKSGKSKVGNEPKKVEKVIQMPEKMPEKLPEKMPEKIDVKSIKNNNTTGQNNALTTAQSNTITTGQTQNISNDNDTLSEAEYADSEYENDENENDYNSTYTSSSSFDQSDAEISQFLSQKAANPVGNGNLTFETLHSYKNSTQNSTKNAENSTQNANQKSVGQIQGSVLKQSSNLTGINKPVVVTNTNGSVIPNWGNTGSITASAKPAEVVKMAIIMTTIRPNFGQKMLENIFGKNGAITTIRPDQVSNKMGNFSQNNLKNLNSNETGRKMDRNDPVFDKNLLQNGTDNKPNSTLANLNGTKGSENSTENEPEARSAKVQDPVTNLSGVLVKSTTTTTTTTTTVTSTTTELMSLNDKDGKKHANKKPVTGKTGDVKPSEKPTEPKKSKKSDESDDSKIESSPKDEESEESDRDDKNDNIVPNLKNLSKPNSAIVPEDNPLYNNLKNVVNLNELISQTTSPPRLVLKFSI